MVILSTCTNVTLSPNWSPFLPLKRSLNVSVVSLKNLTCVVLVVVSVILLVLPTLVLESTTAQQPLFVDNPTSLLQPMVQLVALLLMEKPVPKSSMPPLVKLMVAIQQPNNVDGLVGVHLLQTVLPKSVLKPLPECMDVNLPLSQANPLLELVRL